MAHVDIVIPNWNGEPHIVQCLEALKGQDFQDFDVLVVDSQSTDSSVRLVQRQFPRVAVTVLDENLGFAAAVNIGIVSSRCDYVVLLNNDTMTNTRWLGNLVQAMDEVPEASFGVSKLLRFESPSFIDAAGDGYSIRKGAGVSIGAGESADRHSARAWVFGACAAAAIYRRSLFDDIGFFDEDFFLLFEDVDISMRAQIAGHRCLYVPDAVVYHKRGATIRPETPAFQARALRNRIWVAGKSLPMPLLALWVLLFVPRALGVLVARSAIRRMAFRQPRPLGEWGGEPVTWTDLRRHVFPELLRAFRELPAKRRTVQGTRRVGSLYLLRLFLRAHRPVRDPR